MADKNLEELNDKELNEVAGGEDPTLGQKLLGKDGGEFWGEKGVDQAIGVIADGMKDNGTGRSGFDGKSGRGTGRTF